MIGKVRLLIFFLISVSILSCDIDTSGNNSLATDSTETKWRYSVDEDEMSSAKMEFAEIYSEDRVYAFSDHRLNQSVTPELIIRKKGDKNEVLLEVEHGGNPNYNAVFYSKGDSVLLDVKFDDEIAEEFTGWPPQNGNTFLVFIKPSDLFIKKLLSAKKMLIRSDFTLSYKDRVTQESLSKQEPAHKIERGKNYQESFTMEFDVKGLKWNNTNKAAQKITQ